MAQATNKITLSSSRDIPFDKLVLSQSNVRRIKAGVSVEELAEDIARRGLLQGLSVRPVLDADGVETGKFEIPAGGRRFQALALLVKQKRLAKTAPVPCVLRDVTSDILAEDDSLAENMQRVALHPLDQFRAFVALRDKGQGEEATAAAFFVTPQIVKQRLKLASVAPALLDVYAEDGMTLEQLMAFTVNPDHARQVQVWDAVKNSWNKEPYSIRRMLTETSVRASDRRAVFVGVGAYEAAGGVVLRDLFQGDDGGWLEDPALLDRLVADKLQAEAQASPQRVGSGSRCQPICPMAIATVCGVLLAIRRRSMQMKLRNTPSCSRSIARWRGNTLVKTNTPRRSTPGLANSKLRWKPLSSVRRSSMRPRLVAPASS
jgi:ParB family chromosome partitioning protein